MAAQTEAARETSPPYLLKVQFTEQPCSACGCVIKPGWLYVVGPPVRHVACPGRRQWDR